MKFPFCIGVPGAQVPEWLEKVEITPGNEHFAVMGTLHFSCFVVVYRKSNQYFVRPIFDGRFGAMKLSPGSRGLTITGQWPNNSGKPVCYVSIPLVPAWLLGIASACVVAWLLR
ncbi:hypothetical protein [Paraburkholderia sp. C35]|uniref:DUF7618 family protein n=1 Tax=Paraburkholderia sp. C35 TaxID=2126993 RepID=UPI0013A5879A|nr:hypothetical protein [Paraburkholderia sp. C35]